MDKEEFLDKVEFGRKEKQKVMGLILLEDAQIYLYFIRNILNPDINIYKYDYDEEVSTEYSVAYFGQTDNMMPSIKSVALNDIIEKAIAVDFGMDSNTIRERFHTYMTYFGRVLTLTDINVLLRLYGQSIQTQMIVAHRCFGLGIKDLYDRCSINEINQISKVNYLHKCQPLKYRYFGLCYINCYTFDMYLQLHYKPNMDFLVAGISDPVAGNILIGIFPGDTIEQVFLQYVELKGDFNKVITIH